MFSRPRQQSNGSFTESRNVAAWESLILDLSESRREEEDEMLDSDSNSEEEGGFLNSGGDDPPSRFKDNGPQEMEQNNKLDILQFAQHDVETQQSSIAGPLSSSSTDRNKSTNNDTTLSSSKMPPPPTPQSPSYLRDWIAYYSIKFPPRPNQFDMGSKMNDTYILNAAQIGLSLARYLGEQFDDKHHVGDMAVNNRCISCEDIILNNVIVKDEDSFEAVIESTKYISPSNGGTNNNHRSASNIERRQVLALGMILYELFTQGTPPPKRMQQSLKSNQSVLSFGASLRISESDYDDNQRALGVDRRKNKADGDLDDTDCSTQEVFVRKIRRRQNQEEGKEESVQTLLKFAGVPCSICRLISDMLSNRDDEDFGRLFEYDKSVSRFADVIMDLEQMIEQPKDFLYDKIRLSAKPAVRNKLYSRQKELEQGFELAERTAAWYYQDEDEDEKAGKEYIEACSMDATSSSVKQEVLLVSGQPGSGKSSLVNELIVQLTSYGWESLHCKFDQIGRRQPLSTIASAFDGHFLSLLGTESESVRSSDGNVTLEGIRANLLKAFDEESFSILFRLIPNLRRVVSNNDDNSADLKEIKCEYDESAVISSKIRLHNLFYELLKAISSSWDTPMLLFLDDLHWADSASLELIAFIINEMGANITTGSVTAVRGTNVFIIGTVRTNEVEKSTELAEFLKQIWSCYNVTITDMVLQDLSPADVNVMISEALCYSKRLTQSLAGIVHHKSEGNPFFVKEFLNDLTVENLLVYSFSEKLWDWDEEFIESRTISDGVAEILTRKLLRLPKIQLMGLVMLSCFGSDVSLEVLTLVKDFRGSSDIMNTLDSLTQARFVERTDEKYRFVHDMILHAAQHAVNEDERTIIMKKLLQALLPHGYRDDTILFIVVNLISRVGANKVHDFETRLLYAELNLTAAKKATTATDFASASSCVNCGISFLSAGHWENSYRLSLELFSQSILVEWALGNLEQMMAGLDEVFNNAKGFQDTLRAAHVKLSYLRMTGNCLSEASAYGFQILEQLGETFPANPATEIIVQEILATKQLVTGSLNESKLKSLPELTDSTKKEAMAFLEELLICSYQSHSIHFPLIACRMVQITLQYGLAKSSCIGLISVAISLVTVFSNFSEGYSIAKTCLSIAGSDKRVICYIMVSAFGMINIWKEPIQAILPQLKDTYNMSLKYGLIDNALAAGMLHAYRSFFTGSLLKPLNEEVSIFMRNNLERHKRKLMHLCLLPVSNGIECLSGRCGPQNAGEFITEEYLAEALKNKESTMCECMLAIKMMCSFIFRRLDEVKTIARQYLELFEHQGGASAQFINIYRIFYGGLLSLHFYRESRDQFWMDRAVHAIKKMELWNSESVWNFENKLFLLQAERHYAFGEMDQAAEKYKLAEKSSKTHRFLHEEALACELAADFHTKAGNTNFVAELIDRAVKCYQTWGAEGKVESLLFSP